MYHVWATLRGVDDDRVFIFGVNLSKTNILDQSVDMIKGVPHSALFKKPDQFSVAFPCVSQGLHSHILNTYTNEIIYQSD